MKNKNLPLAIGLSLPVLLILLVAGSIYLPQLWTTPPKINFIYSTNTTHYSSQEYFVENHKLAVRDIQYPYQKNLRQPAGQVKLFFHDVIANKSREITFEEAQKLNLDGNNVSPDGFRVIYGTQEASFFPFFFYPYQDYNNRFIKKENYSKRLNLAGPSYYDHFHFIGWVTQ